MNWEGLSPPYRAIVADPPWPYPSEGGRGPSQAHRPLSAGSRLGGPSARNRYTLLSLDEIAALEVGGLADRDAHLYLWATNAFMVEAHEVARAWGFVPKTILTWVKVHHDDRSRVSMKTGYYFRGATEHVVFAVRGSLPLTTLEARPTAYLWPREPHSVKPPAFFDLVEHASPGPRVELFCRQQRMGWDSWGWGYESEGTQS